MNDIPPNKGCVLVIEPNENFRRDLHEVLLFDEYEAYETENFDTALQFIITHQIDLVVMPYRIEEQTGEAFVNTLRSDPKTASVKTLVYGFAKYLERDWRPENFLVVYFTMQEFLSAVNTALKT